MMIVTIPINIMPTMRNFVNVGQALFAIEVHNGKTIVYDCGGEHPLVVNAVLPYVLDKNSVIDILFISHYDKDHINGIQYLIRHCNIKHVILPMVEEPFKLMPLLDNRDSSFIYRFIMDAATAIHNEINRLRETQPNRDIILPKIHYVLPANEDRMRDYTEESIPIDALPDGSNIPSGRAIRINDIDDWIYLPFNRATMLQKAWERFLDFLGIPIGCNCIDFISGWRPYWLRGRKNDVKNAWSHATGIAAEEINDFSMTLYSGPVKKDHKIGCLFTGDYNAKRYIDLLMQFYVNVWDNINVVQIPHHGSIRNFHDQLIVHGAIHVIPNKEHPYRQTEVNYEAVRNQIEKMREIAVGTWQEPLK